MAAISAGASHRKIFSTGFFAKKLKRFQKDSPSSPSRNVSESPLDPKAGKIGRNISVVDLCSSDEEEDNDNEDEPMKMTASATPKAPSPRKDPPLGRKAPTMDSEDAASGAKSPGRKPQSTVDLCSSGEESVEDDCNSDEEPGRQRLLRLSEDASAEESGSDDEDCAAPAAMPKSPRPIFETAKEITAPSPESRGAIPTQAPKGRLPSPFASVNATEPQTNKRKATVAVPIPPRASWKEFSQKLAERKSEILDRVGTATDVTKKALAVGTISTEKRRLLLSALAPKALSPEAIAAENWEAADYLSVSSHFMERFGSLSAKDLDKLSREVLLVPEGMVSVPEIKAKLSRAQATNSSLEKIATTTNKTTDPGEERIEKEEPSTPVIGLGVGDGDCAPSNDEENACERRLESESNFQWDGTFRLKTKICPTGEILPSGNEDNNVQKLDTKTETKSPSKDVLEGGRAQDSLDFDGIDHPAAPCEEPQYTGTEGIRNDQPVSVDQHLSKTQENSEAKYVDEGDGAKTGGSNEKNDSIKNAIAQYRDNESSSAEKLPEHPEAQVILGEIVTKIVDAVTTRCQQGEEEQSEEFDEIRLNLDGSSETDLSTISRDKDGKQEEIPPLVTVSAKQLLLLALPLVCLAGFLRRIGLFDVSNSIFEGCFRTFLQLHLLGWLLSPIFRHGVKHPGIVGCYALFMIVMASYEASSRTKYTHDDQFTIIFQSLLLSVSCVAMWAFGVILKPRPVWNPRYLLPIVGMLLGNSINGVSVTLDTIATSLVEKQSEVDLYLSFGANQYEAVSGIVPHAIKKGTTPFLNMMCAVGIVSIPGMMTGQILGGSSPLVAARYQAMIIFLIALSTLSTILLSSWFTVMSAFCSHQILRPDRFVKNRKRGLVRLIMWVWGYIFGGGSDMVPIGSNGMPVENSGGLLAEEELDTSLRPLARGFEIRPLRKGSVVSDREGMNSLVQASGLHRYFVFDDGSDIALDTNRRRTLFQDLSFRVNEGDLLLVSGPSGTGKSQLLRMIAGLSPLQEGNLWLQGRSWEDDYDGNHAVEWRRQVRYVTQNKVQIPGTPLQFIKKIQSFRSWKAYDDRSDTVTVYDVMKHVSHHIRQWGMGLDCLDKEWTILSGGESQRVLIAIALASRPKILLFDESTSALDHGSKLAVETSIKDFVEDHEGGVMWISHDSQQAERMMDDSESNGIYGL